MSPRSWKLRVEDILQSIEDVETFTSGQTFQEFESDKKTYFAVIRSLEILGEASHHVPDAIKKNHPDIPWRKMKDFRNVLIHEYFGVDPEVVWTTLQTELLPLRKKLKAMLDEDGK